MRRLAVIRRRFVDRYRRDFSEYEDMATLAKQLIESLLEGLTPRIHKIEARVKDPNSVNLKLFEKQYGNPARQLTDRVGVRVITHFADDVDEVVGKLKAELEIDERRSVDKRQTLEPRAFGYRSVHLIARLKRRHAITPQYALLDGLWFEIQVRSILEHAWAAIDHDVVFKSKVSYPSATIRGFAAIAATLEMLGSEFMRLRSERDKLIEYYRTRYEASLDMMKGFDGARLLGFLEWKFPGNLSWRRAAETGVPFPRLIEVSCLYALKSCGVGCPRSLLRVMNTRRYRSALKTFAVTHGIDTGGVSHLALTVIAIALKDRHVFGDYFHNMLEDPGMRAILRR